MPAVPSRRTRQILLLVLAVLLLFWLGLEFDLRGHANRCLVFLRTAGPWPFFVAMALLPAVGFPMAVFTVTAGEVFGPTLGVGTVIACAIGAQIANMTLCYWIAGHALRPWVARLAAWFGYALPVVPSGSAWEIVLLVRIIPGLPFFAQNYLLGLARIPFGIYLLISSLVHAGLVVGAILAGDALARGDPWALAAGELMILVAVAIVFHLRRRWKNASQA